MTLRRSLALVLVAAAALAAGCGGGSDDSDDGGSASTPPDAAHIAASVTGMMSAVNQGSAKLLCANLAPSELKKYFHGEANCLKSAKRLFQASKGRKKIKPGEVTTDEDGNVSIELQYVDGSSAGVAPLIDENGQWYVSLAGAGLVASGQAAKK